LKDDNAGQRPAEPVPSDYDQNPGRVRLARSVLRRHAAAPDVHELVARRFVAEGMAPVLDVGCGEGDLERYLPDGAWVGLDQAQAVADATELPLSVTKQGALLFARKGS
jgi:2-polyprenyl-3-methyl-5-hydroxy-6-metoxy-1,4-benzoquinol methylase